MTNLRRGDVVLVLFPDSNLKTPNVAHVAVTSSVGKVAGLRLDSVVMTDNVATVFGTEIVSVLGRLPDMIAIDAALKYTLGL